MPSPLKRVQTQHAHTIKNWTNLPRADLEPIHYIIMIVFSTSGNNEPIIIRGSIVV